MGGCRCSYKNCTNTTKSTDNLHFFHYPVKHRERCVLWIEHACKPSFYDLEEEQLRNKVVCEMHFESKWFQNSQKKRLIQGAIPTLDGECNDVKRSISPLDGDAPMYLPSNQYNDVKVLPANDDGTVFILDTENMFTRSPKIESYIIKNGVLVPTNHLPGKPAKQSNINRLIKTSTSIDGSYFSGTETEIANINTPPGPGPSKTLHKGSEYNSSSVIKKESPEIFTTQKTTERESNEFLIYDQGATSQTFQMVHEEEEQKSNPTPVTRSAHSQQSSFQGSSKAVVSKNYLRQIKKHSRDIASIKRMLKQKKNVEQHKPDIKTILNELQHHIPASLLTVLSLLLGEKNDLSEDDIDFFTTIHRASPEVYQLLSEKYKWNLPSVDIVDAPSE